MFNIQKKTGFTLIELLIVIAIIGILAVAFLPSMFGAPAKARDTQRIEDINKLGNLFLATYVETGTLPANWSFLNPTLSPPPVGSASALVASKLADLGGRFPVDPNIGKCIFGTTGFWCTGYYFYYTDSNYFYLTAGVENADNGNSNSYAPGLPLLESGAAYTYIGQKK